MAKTAKSPDSNDNNANGRPLTIAEAEVVAATMDKLEARLQKLEAIDIEAIIARELGVGLKEAKAAMKELKSLQATVKAHEKLLTQPTGAGPIETRLGVLEKKRQGSKFNPYTHINKIESNIGRWAAKGATTILLSWLAIEAVTALVRLMGGGEQSLVIKQVYRAIRPVAVEVDIDLG
jgi:hypothetical protein